MTHGITHNFNGSSLEPGDLQLKFEYIHLSFGGVAALSGFTLDVRQSEIVAIIGPNGAGKTSLLNCSSGLYHPQKGRIVFYNHGHEYELTKLPPHKIAQAGVARSFQNIELFKHMTVLENLMLGRHAHLKSGVLDGMIFWGRAQKEEIEHRQ